MTHATIAHALGLHVSTVTKALKGDPAIARRTVSRVRRKAEELGYRRDPMLSALAAYRKKGYSSDKHTGIAWLHQHGAGRDMGVFPGYHEYFEGARDRAEALGYKLQPFRIVPDPAVMARTGRVLRARGIRLVVVAPLSRPGVRLDLPWAGLCGVAIGYTLAEPVLDRVTNDHFGTMAGLLERLARAGCRRIGVYLAERHNERMGRRAASAFLAYAREYGARIQLYEAFDPGQFRRWVRRFGFDAVVGDGIAPYEALTAEREQGSSGLPAYAGYALPADETRIPGMCHNNRRIGAAAVEFVVSRFETGRFGIPGLPETLLVASRWLHAGSTADGRIVAAPQGSPCDG